MFSSFKSLRFLVKQRFQQSLSPVCSHKSSTQASFVAAKEHRKRKEIYKWSSLHHLSFQNFTLLQFPMIKDTLLLKVSEILDGNQGKKNQLDGYWLKFIEMLENTSRNDTTNNNTHIEVVLLKKIIYVFPSLFCFMELSEPLKMWSSYRGLGQMGCSIEIEWKWILSILLHRK